MKRIASWGLILGLLLSFAATGVRAECESLEVRSHRLESDTSFQWVTGTAVNTSSDTLSFAQVEFAIESDTGQVGEAFDLTNDLGPNAEWNFSALVLIREAARAELAGTTCQREPRPSSRGPTASG